MIAYVRDLDRWLGLKYVMKFGGSSIVDAQAISRAVRIVAEYQLKGHRLVVVVSAFPNVTDELTSISEKAVEGNLKIIDEFVERRTEVSYQHCKRMYS